MLKTKKKDKMYFMLLSKVSVSKTDLYIVSGIIEVNIGGIKYCIAILVMLVNVLQIVAVNMPLITQLKNKILEKQTIYLRELQ